MTHQIERSWEEKQDVEDEKLAYEDYDEAYEDAVYEQSEYIAKRNRRSRPKRDSGKLIPGLVIRALGHHFDVLTNPKKDPDAPNNTRLCEVRRRLRQERTQDTLVAVGDRVWLVADGPERGKIERVDERTSVISRQRPGASQLAEDVILANPDQVLIVFSTAQPAPHLRMLDRFLVIAEFNELPAMICTNKIDLTGFDAARETFGLYEEIGYRVIYTSAETGQGVEELRAALIDNTTVLTGPSGVGKSSLINALNPTLTLEVGVLRDFMQKGKHTTRTAQLVPMPFGNETYIADTPGIRELGLYDIDPADLGFYFIEMEPFVNECRFPNCTHDHEPKCAILQAVEDGHITPERYDSYLRLLKGEE